MLQPTMSSRLTSFPSIVQSLLALLCLTSLSSARLRVPPPYNHFHTEPDFIPSEIETNIEAKNRSELAPGYIFVAPHVYNHGWGPQILDQDGHLVWYGNPTVNKFDGRKTYAMNFFVCDWKGEIGNHLCYSEARPEGHDLGIRTAGANRVFNSSYHQVGPDFGLTGDFTFPNPHEFTMLPGGESFLQSVFEFRRMDLRPYGGKKRGAVFNGCFQEVDVRTEKELFRWCFLDHHPIWNTHIFLNAPGNTENISSPVGGSGVRDDPWDFMHLNALDKNEEDDYLVSGRHLNSIIKVAGRHSRSGKKPGETIWRIGGAYSDFIIDSDEPGANFSMQHHCRYISTKKTETVISLFNNANNGITAPTANYSSAIILTINNVTMRARLDNIYKQPQGRLAYAQGSMQVLPNGNAMVGWGARPQWSEYSKSGRLLHHQGAVADSRGLANYRSFKYPWVGRPMTKPSLVAYCYVCEFGGKDNSFPLVAYVSWNGATEVTHWRFFITFTGRKGPWYPVGTFEKSGFETRAELSSNILTKKERWAPFVAVEALDKDNKILARSYRQTFVPNRLWKSFCNEMGCEMPGPAGFRYNKQRSKADQCAMRDYAGQLSTALLVVVMIALECIDYLYTSLLAPRDFYVPRRRGKYAYALNGNGYT